MINATRIYHPSTKQLNFARVGTSEWTARISRFGPAEHAAPDDVIGGDSLFPWKHEFPLSQRFQRRPAFFFSFSGHLHRTLSGTGEVSFLRHCDGDFFFFYKDSIFSLVCVLTVPFQYGKKRVGCTHQINTALGFV